MKNGVLRIMRNNELLCLYGELAIFIEIKIVKTRLADNLEKMTEERMIKRIFQDSPDSRRPWEISWRCFEKLKAWTTEYDAMMQTTSISNTRIHQKRILLASPLQLQTQICTWCLLLSRATQ